MRAISLVWIAAISVISVSSNQLTELKGHAVYVESSCINSGTLSLSCPLDHMIYVINVTYAISETNECTFHPDDTCRRRELRSYQCSGHRTCTIRIMEQTTHYSKIQPCGLHPSYISVFYHCISEAEVDDIFTSDTAAPGQPGELMTKFISSPHFSEGTYYQSLHATYTLNHYTQLSLKAISIKLMDQHDKIVFSTPIKEATYGGPNTLELYDVPDLGSGPLTIQFITGEQGHDGGFWIVLQYTQLAIPTTTETSTEKTTPRARSIHRETTQTTRTVTSRQPVTTAKTPASHFVLVNNYDRGQTYTLDTLAMIMGISFGICGFVIVAVIFVYFLKRHRDKSRRLRAAIDRESIMFHNMTNECLFNILGKSNTSNNVNLDKTDSNTRANSSCNNNNCL